MECATEILEYFDLVEKLRSSLQVIILRIYIVRTAVYKISSGNRLDCGFGSEAGNTISTRNRAIYCTFYAIKANIESKIDLNIR